MTTATIETPWLTYDEAAQYTRLQPSTLRAMVSAGQIPVYGSRRCRRFRREMLDLWMNDRELSLRKWREELRRGRP